MPPMWLGCACQAAWLLWGCDDIRPGDRDLDDTWRYVAGHVADTCLTSGNPPARSLGVYENPLEIFTELNPLLPRHQTR